ncbi:putative disco-interacting protein 2 isoform X2 [Daphnia sinensis]|uniref:Disco-interacting protein 2 isoform X2 n=1 Tax=Daphnia sinensis TaxID=1820382 RepID=A0AAD5PMS0_9CRUS|nr:putative disco-interacting protein 2 isoform X2 [Daphnia sinensis]
MLDQLRRLVNGSSNGGQTDGIPPSGHVRQSRNHHHPSSGGSTRSGSLSRLTAYALHPQHSGRMRMHYNVVPVSYVAPPPPHPVAVAYGRNGRTTVVGYDPWFQVRYPQQPRTPVGRQVSARPDLAPPPPQQAPPSSNGSSGKKKKQTQQSESSKDRNKEEFRHPTIRRETVVPNNRHRLVPSRSLDSIHPHRIHHHRSSQEKQISAEVEAKSSSQKVKEFFQRVKDTVSNAGTTNGHHQQQPNRDGGGQGHRTDEWLLLRPSVNANSSKPMPHPPHRPTTPGMTAFRKIFSRSPSPTAGPTSTPIKKPLSSTKSLFQQIIRPRSRSVSSTASLSIQSHSTAHSGGAIRNFRLSKEKSKTDLNIVHRNDAGSIQRGNPDGATFPRDSPFHQSGTEPSELLIYAPASEPTKPSSMMTMNNNNNNNPSKRTKFVKKIEQPAAGFRVKRRQSQLRRSERKRRSSRRRSGRKKRNSSSGGHKKLGSSKGSQLGSQSALSGAKLVSDWTYLPLPTSFVPVEEASTHRRAEIVATSQQSSVKETKCEIKSEELSHHDDWESDLYQVLADRGQPRRSGPLPPPMWDPLIFIPPERRRSSAATTVALNESAILVDQQPWIRSSKLRADGKKQLKRTNPTLSPPPPPPLSPSRSSSGDITQKGYEKKRSRLLAPYLPKPPASQSTVSSSTAVGIQQQQLGCDAGHDDGRAGIAGTSPPADEGGSRERRRAHRKATRHESRYHSEVRQEAVQQVLAAMQNRPKPSMPMPSKRTSTVMGPDQQQQQMVMIQQQVQQQQQQQHVQQTRGSLDGSSSGSSSEDDDVDDEVDDDDDDEDDCHPPPSRQQQQHSVPASGAAPAGSVGTPERTHRMHVMGQSSAGQHSPLQHQVSDAGSSHSAGSTRNVTPPLSIQQGRPLPALPVSPPPPQLPPRETGLQQQQHAILSRVGNGGTPTGSNSWMMPPPPPGRPAAPPPQVSSTNLDDDWENSSNDSNDLQRRRVQAQHRGLQGDLNDLTDAMSGFHPYAQPPDVTNNTNQIRRTATAAAADRLGRYGIIGGSSATQSSNASTTVAGGHAMQTQVPQAGASSTSLDDSTTGTLNSLNGRWKVSAKIQQLLNTLKRPKRRPLPEFYEDDDIELELAANPKDPNAPKPEGGPMTPALGDQLIIPSGLPRSLEAAVQRYGSSNYKAPAATVLDPNGKMFTTLTYGKLQSRSYKIAYALLNKLSKHGGPGSAELLGSSSVKPGDRVALVYPNSDAIGFMCAFYGCLHAGVVPVPIEVPLTRRDAGSQQIGFLLGSCGVQVALTSDICLKGLPKTASSGEIIAFKGWPKLHWCVTDNLIKPPKDWQPPPKLQDDTPAYIEYKTDKEGSVMGVTITRSAMLSHCRALTAACSYTEGEVVVCVLDFKREVGLWHAVLTAILNGMHSIFIPYALMKTNPASWMQMITKYKASLAVVKSRDLHWGLLATRDHRDINLSSLRMLLVADGANPWSLSSCDQFMAVFQSKGLRADAVCPCAASSEVLTVSFRRPGRSGANATGRGILSMQGLSFGVVRVDQENSLTSLTLQDCGHVMPGAAMVVVKMEGPPYLCKTDEVGEICVGSASGGAHYWGLKGMSNATFRVQPLLPSGDAMSAETEFIRSGLLGFLGPGGLVFVCGSRDGLMTVTGRKHNTDDIIATVLAVEPMKFIYRGRIAVFSIRVLRDERICVIAEQRPDCSEEESFQWMSRVLQAVDSIHQVGIYCLALVPPNSLPKTPLGGIHLSETRRRFMEGSLHPANVLMCPHTCVTNLPKPREVHQDIGPASVMVGNIVQGNRLAAAQGRELRFGDDEANPANKYRYISEILQWRAQRTSDHVLFTLLGAKGTPTGTLSCAQLHKRAERVACTLVERGRINSGDHVALIYPPGLDLVCAFYGCLYVGAVPVTIRPPHPQNLPTTLPTVRMIVDVSKASVILSNANVIKLLKSKEAGSVMDVRAWPPTLDTDDMAKKKLSSFYRAPTAEMLAYLDFSVSTTGMLAGIKMSHAATTALCRSMKQACELYPSRHVALCLDPYCGLGFSLWCLSSVYSGHHSILIPPSEVEVNPAVWLSIVSQYKVRDTFCSYGVMELCTKGLATSVGLLKQRGLNLACVRTCVVVAEERPRVHLSTSFSKLFSGLGLSPRAVSTSFGCRINVAICLQGASSPDPSTVYVDLRALRNDRVTLVERGAPHSLCLTESGKLLPGVKVIIANPDTKGQCGDSHLGEIWVQAPHNASGYFTLYGDDPAGAGAASVDHFNSRLVTGHTGEAYARTGYLGFLRRTESVQSDGELHDAVFVVGALEETVVLRGMRYHPIDIENTVMRCHQKIAECAVFTWTNLLVVVVELEGTESEALDLVPLVTSSVLEEHQLIVGVVVVVDPGVVPINSRGEKQRMHLRDGFLADQLDPIYVAYNM